MGIQEQDAHKLAAKRNYGKKRSIRNKAHKLREYTQAGPVTVKQPDGTSYELPPYGLVDLARVRAGAKVIGERVPRTMRELVLSRDASECRYCGRPVGPDATPYEIDHVVPRAKGGRTVLSNLVLACRNCNRAKSDQVWTPRYG